MTTERLIDSDPNDLERVLLEAGIHERPAPRLRGRVLGAVGVGVATTAVTTTATAALLSKLNALPVIVWFGGGFLSGVLTMGAGHVVGVFDGEAEERRPSTGAAVAAPAGHAVPPREEPGAIRAPTATDTIEHEPPSSAAAATFDDVPSPRTGADRHSTTRRATPGRVEGQSTPLDRARPRDPDRLAEEVRLLDNARRALETENAREALDALRAREKKFGAGVLGPEATALEVQALLADGRRAEAEAIGRRFLARSPNDPQSSRIRALLAR